MRKAKSGNIGAVKLFFGILGCGILCFMLTGLAAVFLMNQGAKRTPEDVYRIHFTAPIDTVTIIDGGGITWQGGQHYLKFSSPEPVAVRKKDLFKEIPIGSEAARKGIEHFPQRFLSDLNRFSEGDDIKCLYLSDPGNHNETWLFSQRSQPVHFFYSYTN
jgi:hypothetical protein